jgi:hypothetical protein
MGDCRSRAAQRPAQGVIGDGPYGIVGLILAVILIIILLRLLGVV